jgi:hypothetical protein
MMTSERAPSRFGGVLLKTLGSIGAAVVAFVLLFNVMLWTDALEKLINEAQTDVTLHFEVPWAWWPTHLSGGEFQMIVHDPAVQAELRIDDFALVWAPLQLLRKKFHARTIRADGVRFSLRKTRELRELCDMPPGLPVIPGQSLPAEAVEGSCMAQEDTARPKGDKPKRGDVFQVQLDDVRVDHLERLWFERLRTEGTGGLRGDWFYIPTFETRLNVSALGASSRNLKRADETLIRNMGFGVTGELDTVHLRKSPDWKRLIVATATASVRGIRLAPLMRGGATKADGTLDLYFDMSVQQGYLEYLELRILNSKMSLERKEFVLSGEPWAHFQWVADSDRTARLREGRAELRAVRLGRGKDAKTTSFRLTAKNERSLDLSNGTARVGLWAQAENLEPIMILLKGLPKTMVDVLISSDTQIRATARLDVAAPDMRLEDLQVEAGALKAHGALTLSPRMDGEVTAELGPVSVTKKIGGKRKKESANAKGAEEAAAGHRGKSN